MAKFNEKYGPWAIVTGASSGIGKEFAIQIAKHGINVILVARRQEKLTELANELEISYKIKSEIIAADLTSEDFMDTILPKVTDKEVGLLVNNAGYGISGDFLDNDLDAEINMLRLNCLAPIRLTHHFGNLMVKRGRGGIIMVGSILGYMGTSSMTHYAATKGWDLLFGEGLYGELKNKGVDVGVLNPGATITEFAETAGMNIAMAMRVGPVVRKSLKTLGKRPAVIPGLRNKAMYYSLIPMGRRIGSMIVSMVMRSFSK